MTIRTFLGGSLLAALFFWAVLVAILTGLNPIKAGSVGYGLFFLALFLSITSTAALLGYGVRRVVMAHQLAAYRVRSSLRQAVLLGIFTDLLLLLQLMRLVRWWLVILLIFLFCSIEFIFLSYDRSSGRP